MNTPEQDWQDRAMSYSEDGPSELDQAVEAEDFERVLEILDQQSRARLKAEVERSLLKLCIMPANLCQTFVRNRRVS